MQLKPGARLKSTVCTTEVVVVRTPADDVDVRCGGAPMVPIGDDAPGGTPAPGFDGGTLLGKRYADADLGIEILCTKAGAGALSIGDTLVDLKDAKPLPSSD